MTCPGLVNDEISCLKQQTHFRTKLLIESLPNLVSELEKGFMPVALSLSFVSRLKSSEYLEPIDDPIRSAIEQADEVQQFPKKIRTLLGEIKGVCEEMSIRSASKTHKPDVGLSTSGDS